MPDTQPKAARNKRQNLIIGGLLAVVIILGAILLSRAVGTSNLVPTGNPALRMTLDPTIRANLTDLPNATPLSEEDARIYRDFIEQVEQCEDYAPERLEQMQQHIDWLIDPATIPQDMISLFGTNPASKLIFGMATYTSIQWRILERPAASCLIPLGLQLNDMLLAAGETPFSIYDEQR